MIKPTLSMAIDSSDLKRKLSEYEKRKEAKQSDVDICDSCGEPLVLIDHNQDVWACQPCIWSH